MLQAIGNPAVLPGSPATGSDQVGAPIGLGQQSRHKSSQHVTSPALGQTRISHRINKHRAGRTTDQSLMPLEHDQGFMSLSDSTERAEAFRLNFDAGNAEQSSGFAGVRTAWQAAAGLALSAVVKRRG